jgi:hypothetical protein
MGSYMKKVIFVLLIVLLSIDGFGEVESFLYSPRQLSLGGTTLLHPFDSIYFLKNPAIVSYTKQPNFYITKLSLLSGANMGYLDKTLNLSSYQLSSLWAGFDYSTLLSNVMNDPYGVALNSDPEVGLFGPINLGYIGNGIGIMVYDDSFSSLDIKQMPGLPYVVLKSFSELGVTFGVGTYFSVSKFYTLHTGISFSYYKRYKVPFDQGASVPELMNYYEKVQNNIYEYDVSDSLSGNIGLILDDGDHLKYAITLENFFGRTFNWSRTRFTESKEETLNYNYYQTYLPPSLNLGVMYYLPKIPYIPSFLLSEFMVELDIKNLIKSEFWYKKLSLGTEISLLKVVKLRGGINEGYPTFGLGIDFYYLTIDLAVYQYEKGVLPGQQGSQSLSLSLEIKI